MPLDSPPCVDNERFAFGLTTADVEGLRVILREDCDEEVSLEEAWSRAAGLLALTQLLLEQAQPERLEHRPT